MAGSYLARWKEWSPQACWLAAWGSIWMQPSLRCLRDSLRRYKPRASRRKTDLKERTMITDISESLPQSPEHVSGCSSAAPASWSANGNPQAEKRREKKYATREYVEVCLLDMNNLRLRGMLRDISKHAMRIELEMPLKTGDRLEVLLQSKAIIFAEVRYCRRTGESYQVGSVIDDVYYPKTV